MAPGVRQDQGGPNGSAVSIPTGTSYGRRSSFDISTAVLSFTGLLYKDYEEGSNLTYNLRVGASPQTAPVTNSEALKELNLTGYWQAVDASGIAPQLAAASVK